MPGSLEIVLLATASWKWSEADSEPTQRFRTAGFVHANDGLSKATSNRPKDSPPPGLQVEKQTGGPGPLLACPSCLPIPAHFPSPRVFQPPPTTLRCLATREIFEHLQHISFSSSSTESSSQPSEVGRHSFHSMDGETEAPRKPVICTRSLCWCNGA